MKRLAERLQKDLDRQENINQHFFLFLKRMKTDKNISFLKRTKTDKNILFLKRTKRKNNLCRVTGLRGYQGEFTFSGLEDHLFSELRRFRTSSKDELHERELVKLSAIFSDTRLDRLG